MPLSLRACRGRSSRVSSSRRHGREAVVACLFGAAGRSGAYLALGGRLGCGVPGDLPWQR